MTPLRAPPEHPQHAAPAHVERLVRPQPIVKASALAFLRFEKADLDRAQKFWTDFGLVTVSRTGQELVMRCAGSQPAVLVARHGPRARYVGAAFVVPSDADFERLRRESGAEPLSSEQVPGGGRGVSLRDPDGNEVWLITDWGGVEPLPMRASLHPGTNSLDHTVRVNTTVRSEIEPATIGRLGHVVMQTPDFHAMSQWYMRHLGIIPTDVQYLDDGSPVLTFFRLDLGATPADHHTVVIVGGLESRYEHSAWEVLDLDALGQGQQVMRAGGHHHLWGIGRHLLGSQLFDYWKDADGFEFEHYTDGDVFTADRETHYVPFTTGSIWAWGDDAPASMFPRPSLAMLLRAWGLVRGGRLTWSRLKLLGRTMQTPARPWL
ncbi:MAG: biphenyl-2,3-diol 1,2-dioxygenase [Gammaproteobacteria bacterium]|nr:biphenyl-2,3-diol 1,2-dioxygenase [Gammaproteobacteria bacterium]